MPDTLLLPASPEAFARAGELLRAGELVGFPTETVYGLGANAYDGAAVEKIFIAKGRPQNNPLIVHISDMDMLGGIVARVPERAAVLAERFWPGPLTMIMPKNARIPSVVSAGLDTVGVRFPSDPACMEMIRAAAVPVAAPSANRSGLPSPTRAAHVMADMRGRIPLIIDGGPCRFGLESTVIDLSDPDRPPCLLRPGAVTLDMLRGALGEVEVSGGVLSPLAQGVQARSPGLMHKHYSPEHARVVLLGGSHLAEYIGGYTPSHRCALIAKRGAVEQTAIPGCELVLLGESDEEYAASIFDALRTLDDGRCDLIFCQATGTGGIGLAVMNRLLRSAGFNIVETDV